MQVKQMQKTHFQYSPASLYSLNAAWSSKSMPLVVLSFKLPDDEFMLKFCFLFGVLDNNFMLFSSNKFDSFWSASRVDALVVLPCVVDSLITRFDTTVVVFVTTCSLAAIACGTTAIEFAMSAAVSLLTRFAAPSLTSFVTAFEVRFVRPERWLAVGVFPSFSSKIVLKKKMENETNLADEELSDRETLTRPLDSFEVFSFRHRKQCHDRYSSAMLMVSWNANASHALEYLLPFYSLLTLPLSPVLLLICLLFNYLSRRN